MTLEPGESAQESEGPLPGEGRQTPGRPSREYRATVAFLIGGSFTAIALLVYSGILSTSPPIRGAVVVAGVVLGMLAMFVAALGLANGHRWASAVMTPMLWLVVIAGSIQLVWALSRGSIDLPFGLVLGIWALRAPIRTPADAGPVLARWGVAGTVTLVAMLVSTGWPATSGILLGAGGPLIVAEDALVPNLVVTCDASPATPPTFVRIEYDWRWSRAEPWVAGRDSVTLSASTQRQDGLSGYVLDLNTNGSIGTWQSDIMILEPQGVVFGIDLAVAGFKPGSVGIRLNPPNERPIGHGWIDVDAIYLHAPADTGSSASSALWRVVTHGRCGW